MWLRFLNYLENLIIARKILARRAIRTLARRRRAFTLRGVRLALIYQQIVSRGGLERYLLGLMSRLKARGHQLEAVAAVTDGALELQGVPVHRVPLGGVPRTLRQWEFSRRAARVRTEAELTLGFGRTVVQDVHRAGGGCHARYSRLLRWHRRWSVKNRLELALERRLYTSGRTRHFVVNAAPIAQQLQSIYRVPAERFTVIHTAVDTAHFRPDEGRPENKRPVLLFVASHHRRKGLDALLRALATVPGADLWIAGASLGSYAGMVARLGLGDRVKALGDVRDMAALYRQADWFVHPTLYDACANTVLQSMACALPGLISVEDGAHEFIADGSNGLLLRDPSRPEAVATALRHALGLSTAERRALGDAARATVLPLTWDAHVDAWERVMGEKVKGER